MKRRSSNQIRNFIICFVIFMMLALVGLIIFLLTVDVKNFRNYSDGQVSSNNENSNNASENQETEDIDVSDYELTITSYNGDIEVQLSEGKVLFSVIRDDVFKENYPNSVIDTITDAVVAIHENVIEDIFIGKIGEKNYLFVLTDKGSVGVMDIDDAVENDVFRIKNKLISFDSPVVRMANFRGISSTEKPDTVIVTTQDGKRYDLNKFVE